MSSSSDGSQRRVDSKLVRDRIPELVSQQGGSYVIRTLDDSEFRVALLAKLQEEAAEAAEAINDDHLLEELADVLEVVKALAGELPGGFQSVEQARIAKREQRGGFDERVLMSEYRPPATQ